MYIDIMSMRKGGETQTAQLKFKGGQRSTDDGQRKIIIVNSLQIIHHQSWNSGTAERDVTGTVDLSNLEGVELFGLPEAALTGSEPTYGEAWRGDTESVQTDPMSASAACGNRCVVDHEKKKLSKKASR